MATFLVFIIVGRWLPVTTIAKCLVGKLLKKYSFFFLFIYLHNKINNILQVLDYYAARVYFKYKILVTV